jgi:uncharacterized protein (DUF58 family)
MQPGNSATDATSALATVLAPGFLRKLDRLHLSVRRSLSTRPGNTPMPRGSQGSGIEIERHKAYDAGDDLRHLDWNAYGRLDELLIKTFRAEREAPLHIFIDASASMAVPAADAKFTFALSLAASLAYVSVRNHDPVRAVGLSAAFPRASIAAPFLRHRSALHSLRDFLLRLQPHGETALAPGIAGALMDQRSPGVAVVLSDFLVPPDVYEPALADLLARRFTVAAVRIIGPAERDPTRLFRRGALIDAETGKQRFITLHADNLARYEGALSEHIGRLQAFCNRCGIAFCVADTGRGIEHCIFHDLPAAGLVH